MHAYPSLSAVPGVPQLSRCQRELERVEGERDRAREDARRCAPLT